MSHPQALSQCSEYLEAHGLRPIQWSNTAAAARYVAQEAPAGVAAICSQEAAREYGLTILEEGIQNEAENTTRFILISREAILPQDAGKISLCFALPHVTGSLSGVLQRFAMAGLNLTKIESRPLPGRNFEYDFYLDFTGNLHQPATLELICALQEELPRFSFLGNYSER
ncbi:putative chorismate mutase [Firmicutes bacterium CAG:94]|nr:putative chorismate mutase [Firmicutes bacterium CAG:94]